MKNIVFHIGAPKTGTTSIQNFLSHNKRRLLRGGVLYSRTANAQSSDHRLAAASVGKLEAAESCEKTCNEDLGLGSFPAWVSFKQMLRYSVQETLLVSSEKFYRFPRPDLIREFLGDHSYKIILYLRRQDDFLESFYQQTVKGYMMRQTLTIDQWIEGRLSNEIGLWNYWNIVRRWVDGFGKKNVVVKLFADEIESGLEMGFVKEFGFSDSSLRSFEIPSISDSQKRNVSMDIRCLEYLRQINSRPIADSVRDEVIQGLIGISEELRKQGTFKKRLLREDLRLAIMAQSAESNELLRSEFFPQRQTLFPITVKEPVEAPLSGDEDFERLLGEFSRRMTAKI